MGWGSCTTLRSWLRSALYHSDQHCQLKSLISVEQSDANGMDHLLQNRDYLKMILGDLGLRGCCDSFNRKALSRRLGGGRTLLGFQVHQAGMVYSIGDHSLVGRAAQWQPTSEGWSKTKHWVAKQPHSGSSSLKKIRPGSSWSRFERRWSDNDT